MNFQFYPYNSFVDQFPLLFAIQCNANFKVLTLFNSRPVAKKKPHWNCLL